MHIDLQQFRQIASGTHNVGDVRINGDALEKVNNFVHRTDKNGTVLAAQENLAVRTALYQALSDDARMTPQMLAHIRRQLLGDNAVRSLSRQEVAVYLSALDRGSTEDLDAQLVAFRTRIVSSATTSSVERVKFTPSANERLDAARMLMQKTRQHLELICDRPGGAAGDHEDELQRAWTSFRSAVISYAAGDAQVDGQLENLENMTDFRVALTATAAKDLLRVLIGKALELVPPQFRDEARAVALGTDPAAFTPTTRLILLRRDPQRSGVDAEPDEAFLRIFEARPESEVPATEFSAAAEAPQYDLDRVAQEVGELTEEYPIASDDRAEYLRKANRLGAIIDVKLQELTALAPNARSADHEKTVGAYGKLQGLIAARAAQIHDLVATAPTSYRNVLAAIRIQTRAADALYRQICEEKHVAPNELYRCELFLTPPALDGVRNLDADCPNPKKYLEGLSSALTAKLSTLLGRQGVSRSARSLSSPLKKMWHEVLNHEPWAPVVKRLSFSMTMDDGPKNVAATSSIVPAKGIPGFAANHPYEPGVNGIMCHCFDSSHAVNAAQSSFVVDGRTAFVGMRHGVICAVDIADDDARAQANTARARELVTATALTNAALLEKVRAKDFKPGQPLDFLVTSTSLLTPDAFRGMKIRKGAHNNEKQMLEEQVAAWRRVDGQTFRIKVPQDDGSLVEVDVRPTIVPFNFGVNEGATGRGSGILGGWGTSDALNRGSMERLRELVKDYRSGLRRRIDNPGPRDDVAQLKYRDGVVSRLMYDIESVLAVQGERRDQNDAYKVVARINVLTWLMGGTPAWNCKSGKDRTAELDVESKFLALKIAKGRPIPRPSESLSFEDKRIFALIALQGGNHEMQVYNTGIAGFKTGSVKSIKNRLGGEAVKTAHAGGAKLVKA